jgi:hypothetical protein
MLHGRNGSTTVDCLTPLSVRSSAVPATNAPVLERRFVSYTCPSIPADEFTLSAMNIHLRSANERLPACPQGLLTTKLRGRRPSGPSERLIRHS